MTDQLSDKQEQLRRVLQDRVALQVEAIRAEDRRRPVKEQVPGYRALQCSAHRIDGKRCGNYAIPGGTVCRFHGGGSPQVKKKAALRLASLIEPAISVLAREMLQADKSADRQRAANSILDRAGIVRQSSVDTELAKAMLVDRLKALAAAAEDDATDEQIAQVQADIDVAAEQDPPARDYE